MLDRRRQELPLRIALAYSVYGLSMSRVFAHVPCQLSNNAYYCYARVTVNQV